MKKTLWAAGAAIVILSAGLAVVHAQTGYLPIVERIAEKFNLNVDEVQQVFDEFHQERPVQDCQARLDKMVEDGLITQEQADLLSAKKEEMRNKMEELRGLSPEERKAQMEELRTEMENWVEENGIEGFMMFEGPRHQGGFFR